MSGALIAMAALGANAGGGSGGSDATPAAIAFTNANGDIVAFTNQQTISAIDTTISLKVTFTGGGRISYVKSGGAITTIASGAAFNVINGDTLYFAVSNNFGSGTVTGTVTITNLSDSSTVIATFNYTVSRSFI